MPYQVSAAKQTLSSSDVHTLWEHTYRNTQSERFYERVFDWIAKHEPLQDLRALDIGCGIGQHSIRLAKRGCNVVAADFSEDRVVAAKQNIEDQGFGSRISVRNEDLEAGLSFPDGSYDIVLCWGVLMHIPHIEPAIREMVRVTRPGGRILICEANLFGVDAIATFLSTAVKKVAGRAKVRRFHSAEFGLEYWTETTSGELFIRHSKIGALTRFFAEQGCTLKHRIAGEFTEKYSLGGPLSWLAHSWNQVWFSAGHFPYLAHGNLLVFERNTPDSVVPRH